MFTSLLSLAVGALKLLNIYFEWMESNKKFEAGQKDMIAKQLQAALVIIGRAKEISDEVDKMSNNDVDDKLRDLANRM